MKGTWQGSGTWKTSGGGSRRGGLVLAVIAAAVLAGSVPAAGRALAGLLVTLAVVFGAVLGAAVLAGVAWLACRARQDRRDRQGNTRPAVPLPPAAAPRLQAPQPPAIEPAPEIHLHLDVSPGQLAAIMRHHSGGNQP